jgi:hypothetical protein
MENLSHHQASSALHGFGINTKVSPELRRAIRSVSPRRINTNPENFLIDFIMSEEVDESEIRKHFPQDWQENVVIHPPVQVDSNPA